jgi:hypothetical protein
MPERKPYIYAYISTDLNEAREIIEGRKLDISELVRAYYGSTAHIHLNGGIYPITNLDSTTSSGIRRGWNLNFDPMSVLYGEIGVRDIDIIVDKLVSAGLFVDISDNGKVRGHKPNPRK